MINTHILTNFFEDLGRILAKYHSDRAIIIDGNKSDATRNFARYLRAARSNANLSCLEVAEKANLTEAEVFALEQSLILSTNIKLNTLYALADVLDVDIDDFALLLEREIPRQEVPEPFFPVREAWRSTVAYFESPSRVILVLAFLFVALALSLWTLFNDLFDWDWPLIILSDRGDRGLFSNISQYGSSAMNWVYHGMTLVDLPDINFQSLSISILLILLIIWVAIQRGDIPLSMVGFVRRWQRLFVYASSVAVVCLAVITYSVAVIPAGNQLPTLTPSKMISLYQSRISAPVVFNAVGFRPEFDDTLLRVDMITLIPEEPNSTLSIAWGDVDNDGDLDLAIGNYLKPVRLHLNNRGKLSESADWTSEEKGISRSVAWGDVDSDGDLDLAVGYDESAPNRLYLNEGGELSTTPAWTSEELDSTWSVAWADVDGDGDLDLAAGNWQGTNKLYLNENGALSTTATWATQFDYETRSVAWGDVDNDGDLDLAVGNWNGPNLLYLNDGNMLSDVPAWSSNELDETTSLAWGDINGDSRLDLIVGNFKRPTRIYLNDGGTLSAGASWSSDESDITWSVALGDADGDGDLDLATGNANSANRLYRNSGGILLKSAVWSSAEVDETWSVAWGDIDGEGDLDLAAGNTDGPERLYLNRGNTQLPFQVGGAVQIGQLQPEEDFGTNAYFYSTPLISERGLITIPYKAILPEAQSVREVDITYSLDGGGQWIPAIGSHVSKPDLATSVSVDGFVREFSGTYLWNVFDSGFYGQSDNVLIRVEIHLSCMNSCRRTSIAVQSYPFRVRGSQVYVEAGENESKTAVKDAIVYRMSGDSQSLIADPLKDTGHIARTNRLGYLQGRGELKVGDRLMAAMPITATETYTLFYTSANPTVNGLELVTYTVEALGLQTLTVLPSNPLLLFNISVSLEWDARNNQSYLDRLESDLHRASELLYDWSNGQAALGDITIYQNREQWGEADIRIHSSNRLRPHATIGGSVPGLMLDMIEKQVNGQTESITHLYKPGHVEMSALWNRYGEPGENLGEDWARTLTHELGHYLFFLHDNYVGLDANNQILRVESCPDVMSNPYSDIYSEFHPMSGWENNCKSTFAEHHLGQSAWETVVSFYPKLDDPTISIDVPDDTDPTLLMPASINFQFNPSVFFGDASHERYEYVSNIRKIDTGMQDGKLDITSSQVNQWEKLGRSKETAWGNIIYAVIQSLILASLFCVMGDVVIREGRIKRAFRRIDKIMQYSLLRSSRDRSN